MSGAFCTLFLLRKRNLPRGAHRTAGASDRIAPVSFANWALTDIIAAEGGRSGTICRHGDIPRSAGSCVETAVCWRSPVSEPDAGVYCRNGAGCLKLAARQTDLGDRAILLAFAEGWRALAERAEAREKAGSQERQGTPLRASGRQGFSTLLFISPDKSPPEE